MRSVTPLLLLPLWFAACAEVRPFDENDAAGGTNAGPGADPDAGGTGGAGGPGGTPDAAPNRPGTPDARSDRADAGLSRDADAPDPRRDAAPAVPAEDAEVDPPRVDGAVIQPVADAASGPAPERRPIVFVHGINGSHADFDVMVARFIEEGWPRDWLVALDYADPAWGCNADNGAFLDQAVERLRRDTGAPTVDVVAHSMGTLSSRYYLQRLGGHELVAHYITLGGLHHGNGWSCLNPLPVCVWQELCPTNPFLSDLNSDPEAPGTPVAVSICSTSDETADVETCHFDPMENIVVDGPTHSGPTGLLEHDLVWPIVRDIIRRPVAE